MVTLHIAKLLADEGFGTLDSDIFWEDMPIDAQGVPKNGLWVVPRGTSINRFTVTTQAFDIYSRYSNKITGSQKLEDILDFFQESFQDICELPIVPPYSLTEYSNVRITPTSGIENVGSDEQDKVVRVISAEIKFNNNKES